MRPRDISVRALVRRAVRLHASMTLPLLVACSGQVASTAPGDGGAQGQDVGNDTCAITSSTSLGPGGGGSCYGVWYPFSGTAEQCTPDGGLSLAECQKWCPPTQDIGGASVTLGSCTVYDCNGGFVPANCPTPGALSCIYESCAPGRRPAGLARCRLRGVERPVARFLARAAYMEAASVDAFERLAEELSAHGAPRRLSAAALRAADDERRHAQVVGEWAARAGTRASNPRVARGVVRSLEAVARENAVEGCVRETFAAAVAMAQATNLSDAKMRTAMRRIASDEVRHAELAWRVARWIEPRLAPASRERIEHARRSAARALLYATSRSPDPSLVRALAVPTAPQARAIAKDLDAALWSGPRR